MGQRLTIQIYDQRTNAPKLEPDQSLATIYYHWSGYSTSAIEEAQNLVTQVLKLEKEQPENTIYDNLLLAIQVNSYTGIESTLFDSNASGGIDPISEGDINYIKSLLSPHVQKVMKTSNIDRNLGLLSFSPEAQENALYWSEMPIGITFTDNGVFGNFEDIIGVEDTITNPDTDFIKNNRYTVPDDHTILNETVPIITPPQLTNVPFKEWDLLCKQIENLDDFATLEDNVLKLCYTISY